MTSLIVFVSLVFAGGLVIGAYAGDWLGERRARLDYEAAWEARRAVREVRAWREPPEVHHEWIRPPGPPGTVITEPLTPTAQSAWDAHAGQALALVRGDLTDSAYTQDMADRMDRFLEELLRVPYSADELWSGQ